MNLVVTSTDLRMRVGNDTEWFVIVDRVYYHLDDVIGVKHIWKKSFKDFASAHAACNNMAHGAALMSLELEQGLEQPFLPAEVVPHTNSVSFN